MLYTLKKLSLGIALIIVISAVLIISDWSQRKSREKKIPRIAIMVYTSNTLLEETVQGYIDGLAKRGYIDGKTIQIKIYNPQGDVGMANIMAKEIINQQFDMVITASTIALKVMANANKQGTVMHVFGAVTDPYSSGVGIDPLNHKNHPKHLVGVGSFQPVEQAFKFALKMFPKLKIVGTPWSIAETNSEACVEKARKFCKGAGIVLLESPIENSTGVLEAVQSLCSKGVEAIWVGGDNAVDMAIDLVVKTARDKKIPVFTTNPANVSHGTLFAVGANNHEVGLIVANVAADVLDGKNPEEISIENIVPERVFLNNKSLQYLKDDWKFPEEIVKKADSVFVY